MRALVFGPGNLNHFCIYFKSIKKPFRIGLVFILINSRTPSVKHPACGQSFRGSHFYVTNFLTFFVTPFSYFCHCIKWDLPTKFQRTINFQRDQEEKITPFWCCKMCSVLNNSEHVFALQFNLWIKKNYAYTVVFFFFFLEMYVINMNGWDRCKILPAYHSPLSFSLSLYYRLKITDLI